MHMDGEMHAKTVTFQIEEQANSNNVYTYDDQPITNRSEEEQVCIYE
jgi:hypothetical protein